MVARAYPSGGGQYYFFDWLGSTIAHAPLTEGTRTDRLYFHPSRCPHLEEATGRT
ncbi:MAG: hypothetical protein IT209_00380 [Armatimonadetes bacterium]|nr:hypothetical protein [Armatimonadota bacterium]